MNISLNQYFNNFNFLADIDIGKHLYWELGNISFHGQVLLVSSFIILGIILVALINYLLLKKIPNTFQNFIEVLLEYIIDITQSQLGEDVYRPWVPFIGTLFIFIFCCNWAGAIIPWKIINFSKSSFGAPTNDINTTVALAFLTSCMYFYAGISKKGFSYFKHYIKPTPFLLPINILEDFTKPLSLSFRLFGNILADELTVSVLTLLIPLLIPLPLMLLGLFTSSVQALIFATLASAYIAEAIKDY
uniref:ATP synthase subunit a, chloroplastic n=1 Tax=Phaeophyceae sp. TaxID=2249243 RepID=A0A8E5BGA4_9PHAE|nr:ATP synthase CF0 A chain subunit IV [Phaeophyceae sp.]